MHHAKCQVMNEAAGAYNATIQFRDWGNTYGRSWNHSDAMYLMFDGSLGMFEVFPGELVCVCVCVCVCVLCFQVSWCVCVCVWVCVCVCV